MVVFLFTFFFFLFLIYYFFFKHELDYKLCLVLGDVLSMFCNSGGLNHEKRKPKAVQLQQNRCEEAKNKFPVHFLA